MGEKEAGDAGAEDENLAGDGLNRERVEGVEVDVHGVYWGRPQP